MKTARVLTAFVAAAGLAAAIPSENQKMDAYAKLNPQCAIWTDWKTLCTRTSDGSPPHCVAEPSHTSPPTAPFCIQGANGNRPWQERFAERSSAERYCARFETVTSLGTDRNGARTETSYKSCGRFQIDRPFNSRRVAARRHPACEEWSDEQTAQVICREGRHSTVPSCETLARRNYTNNGPLVCSRFKNTASCRDPYDMIHRDETVQKNGIQAGGATNAEWWPAIGVICEQEKR